MLVRVACLRTKLSFSVAAKGLALGSNLYSPLARTNLGDEDCRFVLHSGSHKARGPLIA